jgi:hypothetical protein
MSQNYRPDPGQTGTGVGRDAGAPLDAPERAEASEDRPDERIGTGAPANADASVPGAEPNRSGSGGSGGSRAEDSNAEGSTGATTEELHEGG